MTGRCTTSASGPQRIRENLQPGITEQELWAHLAYENAKQGGEWFDYRTLSAGDRTNPWGRECSAAVIQAGEIVTVDTGMVGPLGYSADVSRTFLCPPGRPTQEQRRFYRAAADNLQYNIDLVAAGMGFREFSEKSWPVPDEFWARRYNAVAHGVGMSNQWPFVPLSRDWPGGDSDGVFEENMVLALETCIGREERGECVKLEDMVVIRQGGCEVLSTFPLEEQPEFAHYADAPVTSERVTRTFCGT